MKAAPFSYVRAGSVDQAVEALCADDSAKVLGGGQSLLPVLAMRLARPGTLVDITRARGLGDIRVERDRLVVGAAVRQREVERMVKPHVPLLARAIPWIGHREIRSRGTVCGSLAHADPAAELPAMAVCLDAEITLRGPEGTRTLHAAAFYTGAMSTALGAGELVTHVGFPLARPDEEFGFAEMARRHGDFALAGVGLRLRRGDRIELRVCPFGVAERPRAVDLAPAVVEDLVDRLDDTADEASAEERVAPVLRDNVQDLVTSGDHHASRDYRIRVLAALTARELVRSWRRSGHAHAS